MHAHAQRLSQTVGGKFIQIAQPVDKNDYTEFSMHRMFLFFFLRNSLFFPFPSSGFTTLLSWIVYFFVCLSIAFFRHVKSQMLQKRNYEYEANDFRTAWIGCGLVESNNFNFLIFFFHVPCPTCSQNAILILCNIVLIEKKNRMKKKYTNWNK